MKTRLLVREYMTPVPLTAEASMSVRKGLELMREYRIRHLPVAAGNKLVGIVSDRDLKVALAFPGPGELSIADVMHSDIYSVHPNATLKDVVNEMADQKYGCAVVQGDREGIAGIFTATDALLAFSEMLSN